MQIAVWINVCNFYDVDMTVSDKRQKPQKHKSKDSKGIKLM